jgi:CheY-like chemotaxis protein
VLSDIRRDTQDSGLAFAREIRARYPEIPVFFYCGFVNDETRHAGPADGCLGRL